MNCQPGRHSNRDEEIERIYQERVDCIPGWIWDIDTEGRYTFSNSVVESILGYSASEIVGKKAFDLMTPEDAAKCNAAFAEAVRTGEPVRNVVHRCVGRDGNPRTLESSCVPLTKNGVLAGFRGISRDIAQEALQTSRERLRRQQRALIEMTKKQALAGSDLAAALREITYLASHATDVERLSVWLYTQDRSKIVCLDLYESSKDEHSSGYELLVSLYPIYFATIEESRVVAHDAMTAEYTKEFTDTYLQPYGITSMMDAAVRLRGQVIGMVCFEHTGPARHWTSDEVNFAVATANLAALAIETSNRAEAEDALRTSEARYRLLFERVPDMVATLENGRFQTANPAIYSMLGYQPSEIIGLAPWDISPEFQPDGTTSKDKVMEHTVRALESGPHTFPWVHRHKDGTLVHCEVSVAAYRADDDICAQAIVRDITERRRAEEERLALERGLEEQKRSFYRETILSVTDGKLDIREESDLIPYISNAEIRTDLRDVPDVPAARHQIERYCREHGLTGERLDLFITGAGEAITNAIKHGVEGKAHAGATDGEIWVAVADRGPGIESLVLPRAVLARGFSTKPSLGLGYSIMLGVADRILLSTGEAGTIVVLIARLAQAPSEMSVEQLPDGWSNLPE